MHFLCSYFCFQSHLLLLPVDEIYKPDVRVSVHRSIIVNDDQQDATI